MKGCLPKLLLVILAIFIIGLFVDDDSTTSNDDSASFTCIFCREIFVDTQGNGLIIYNTNSIGQCSSTKFYGGSKTGYCSSLHCEMGN